MIFAVFLLPRDHDLEKYDHSLEIGFFILMQETHYKTRRELFSTVSLEMMQQVYNLLFPVST